MINEYPAGYMLRIKAVDGIIFLAGLSTLAIPALFNFYPGDIDTTVHVTLGALVAVCAVFRVLVAYGSAWLEVVLCVLGIFIFMLPRWMHMSYDPRYATVHLALGAVIAVLAIISGLMTFAQLRSQRSTSA
jgi:hypothetical protein